MMHVGSKSSLGPVTGLHSFLVESVANLRDYTPLKTLESLIVLSSKSIAIMYPLYLQLDSDRSAGFYGEGGRLWP